MVAKLKHAEFLLWEITFFIFPNFNLYLFMLIVTPSMALINFNPIFRILVLGVRFRINQLTKHRGVRITCCKTSEAFCITFWLILS